MVKKPAAVKSARLSRVLAANKRPAAVDKQPAAFKSTRLTGFDCIKKFFPRHEEISVQKKVPGPGCDIFVNCFHMISQGFWRGCAVLSTCVCSDWLTMSVSSLKEAVLARNFGSRL